jgi:phosphate transport system permease protein
MAVPIAVFTAIYLVEYGRGRFARIVSFMVDILTGIPSIVAALFIYAVWVGLLGRQRVAFSVSLALVLLMIPVVVRSTQEMLKLVPNELREASYALGVPKWKTISRIVLPTAASGIITGILLGLARVMGETAPLIILAPYTAFINMNLFNGNMAALPTLIFNNFGSNIPAQNDRMWAAALTLIVVVLLLNLAGRFVARFSAVRR